jgi:transposase-like protein
MKPPRSRRLLVTASPSRVAVGEKQIKVDGEKKWLYAAIDTESKLLLEVDVFSRRGTDPAAFTRTQFSCSPSERGAF